MKKLPFPTGLDAVADAADERLQARQSPPRVAIQKTKDGWKFSCPYSPEHEEHWHALLADAFGTRHGGAINHFLHRLVDLVPQCWDEKRQAWIPDQNRFDAALAMVSSFRPENEAQAAYAAQLVALDMSAAKLSERCGHWVNGDPRTAAILSKTVRAFGDGMERLARLQGKVAPKQSTHTMQVVYVDNRDQRVQQQFNGGVAPNGGQAHERECYSTNTATQETAIVPRSSTHVGLAPLPSSRPNNGEAMSLPCGEGKARLPDSWWLARLWRSVRRA